MPNGKAKSMAGDKNEGLGNNGQHPGDEATHDSSRQEVVQSRVHTSIE